MIRRIKQNCGNCDAFQQTEAQQGIAIGLCQDRPPVVMIVTMMAGNVIEGQKPQQVAQGMFPPTDSRRWCRRWGMATDGEA